MELSTEGGQGIETCMNIMGKEGKSVEETEPLKDPGNYGIQRLNSIIQSCS